MADNKESRVQQHGGKGNLIPKNTPPAPKGHRRKLSEHKK